jgi:2-methylcitrate dehydratase PrpD
MGGKHDPEQISGKLGDPFFLMDPGLHIKRYPCAILIHPAIKAAIELAQKHDLKAENIRHLDVGVSEVVTSTLNHPEPNTGLEGKFSVAFPLALALLDRKVSLTDFTDDRVNDPKVRALMKKIAVHTDESLQESGANEVTAKLAIHLQDGQRLDRLATLETGKSQVWITENELKEKFRACAARVLSPSQINTVLDLLLRIELLESISRLLELIRTDTGAGS